MSAEHQSWKPFAPIVIFIISIVNLCHANGWSHGQDQSPKRMWGISGCVKEYAAEFTEAAAEQLKLSGTPETFEKAILSHFGSWASNAVVHLSGNNINKETWTDEWGKFEFTGITSGDYEVLVEKNRDILGVGTVRFSTKQIVKLGARHEHLDLFLGENPTVTLKGRVVDKEGNGVPNIKLMGYFTPIPEQGEPQTFKALTGKNGVYTIEKIPQPSVWTTRGWLNGGDPVVGQADFYFEIHAEDDSRKGVCPVIPLVSERLLEQARRLHEAMNVVQTRWDEDAQRLSEKPKDAFPESKGNTIFVPDIVLKKATE